MVESSSGQPSNASLRERAAGPPAAADVACEVPHQRAEIESGESEVETTSDDDAVLAVVAKLVEALDRAFPASHDLELRRDALRLGREILRGTEYGEKT